MSEKAPVSRELSQALLSEQLPIFVQELFETCQSFSEYKDAAALAFADGGRTLEFFINNIRHTITSKSPDGKNPKHRIIFRVRNDSDGVEDRVSMEINKLNPKFSVDNEIIYQKTKGSERLVYERNTPEAVSHAYLTLNQFRKRKIRPRSS